MSLPRYPDYRYSGVDWLGEAPAHWRSAPLWTLFRRTKRVGFQEEQLLSVYRDHGVVPKASRDDNNNKASEDLSSYQLVESGDLAINKMKAWQGSVAISEYRGIVSPAYFVYEAIHGENNRFLHYLLRSPRYITGYMALSKGIRVNQWDLEPQYHSRMPVLLPPRAEQSAIAAFLDRETAKIDALVAEQEKLIALLAEKRQTTISQAVTKGLNPDAPMKDSGVPWLGEVPAHWDTWKIRHAFECVGSGTTPPSDEDQWYEGGTTPWVTTGELREGVITETTKAVTSAALGRFTTLKVHPKGALVVAMYGATIGRLGILGVAATTNQACCALSGEQGLTVRFTYYWLMAFKEIVIAIYATGGGQPNISQEVIAGLRVPAPSLEEQLKISEFLDGEFGRFAALISEAENLVILLRERRSALIAAAVTGQIDVRGVVEAEAA